LLPLNAVDADRTKQTIVLRVDPPDRKVLPGEVELKTEGKRVHALTVSDPSTVPLNVALVIDAGPNQAAVLNREKNLAVSILEAISVPANKFLVVRAGHQHTTYPATSDKPEALRLVEALTTESGEKSGIPIYEAMASAIGELSKLPGLRVLIVIAEGNDYGSTLGFKELRALVEARHVTCLVALVDDHPTRGTKSILRYGWSLQDLANDTAGTFVENSRKVGHTATRLGGMVASLRLITFEITGPLPGRHRVSVSSTSRLRLHAPKAISSETPSASVNTQNKQGGSAASN
jgi:hypothetical protein